MDFNLNHIKQYPDAAQDLVFGYVRDGFENTPDLISYTILAFYHIEEHFDKCSVEVAVSEDRSTITKLSRGWKNTSYGKNKVLTKDGGSIRWKIKINHFDQFCVIGIDEGQNNTNAAFWNIDTSVHYSWAADDGAIRNGSCKIPSWRPFSDPGEDGDILCIELDNDRNTLGFAINDGEMKTAFTDVKPTEIEYSLAVYLYDENDSVSIVSMEL